MEKNQIRYSYMRYRGMWRVYDNSGKRVAEFNTMEEARERVYLLNGWQMR